MTNLIDFTGDGQQVQIWDKINPTSGNNNFVVSGGGDGWHTGKTFHGVDQTFPFGPSSNTNTASGASGDAAVTITTAADNMTTEVVGWKEETGANLPTNANTVEDSDSNDVGEVEPRGQDSHTDTTGAITVGWANSDGTNWAIAVADISAAVENLCNTKIAFRTSGRTWVSNNFG